MEYCTVSADIYCSGADCGGILGFCSDSEGLAFRVEDCTFTGCERGLGNAGLPDVGTKS